MSTQTQSRKRKRDTDSSQEVTLQLSELPEDQLGPVLASFPALVPPSSTSFRYRLRDGSLKKQKKKGKGKDKEEFVNANAVLEGETDVVEFASTPDSPLNVSEGCSYLVGIYDKRTSRTTLRPAPIHVLTRSVKSLQNLAPMAVSVDERMQLRNALGETFGTKKAKAAIRAAERRRVDVDAIRGVAGHLQERIGENTESLPSKEEAKAEQDASRLVPPYDASAQHPKDAYPLHGIIPEAEFNALSVTALKNASSTEERMQALPFNRSQWIKSRLNLIFSAPKPKKSDLKIVLYISTLIAFKQASRQVNDKQALQKRLKGIPTLVVDALVTRFTEGTRNSNEVRVTSQMETRLLTHIFALCLHIDDFATDPAMIAQDLSMDPVKVNTLFRSLGCKLQGLTETDVKRLGLPDAMVGTKRAVLKVPLEFPTVRVKRARR
ncbi:RNA polymerase I associated factor A49-like protein [Panus rudis PR-1116 ss-1]|nr:RNA polymerase I associated factor A49-like protein [Panus rudis PR-1116 ss-1]